jgi:ABC-type spermidine/putrescine transport system permease subunit I
MKNLQMLLMEAIAVGILVVLLGYVVVYFMETMKLKMNKDKQMIIGFFMLGFLTHILCEFTGVNKWYCKNGRACLK